MLHLKFFARVREQLDCASLELSWSEDLADLNTLQQQLVQARGERWRKVLSERNLIRAVNQVVIQDNCPLKDGDEVAFFPPVTGG